MKLRLLLSVLALVASGVALGHGAAALPAVVERDDPGLAPQHDPATVRQWVYQLQGYGKGRLVPLAGAEAQLAVVDLAKDAHTDYFAASEIDELRESGKIVLAYFEIGSIENFRPEYPVIRDNHPGLLLNRWDEWPEEFFVQYWRDLWWRLAVRPRLDRALSSNYDGVYLDTLLAYEEIPLRLSRGRTRGELAQAMSELVGRMAGYAEQRRPGFLIVPQNSPELARHAGYVAAIDGIGMEELFFRAHDRPCTPSWCQENLDYTRALQMAGKFVLAVDYARDPDVMTDACDRYRSEGFAGYVTVRALDRVSVPCPANGPVTGARGGLVGSPGGAGHGFSR